MPGRAHARVHGRRGHRPVRPYAVPSASGHTDGIWFSSNMHWMRSLRSSWSGRGRARLLLRGRLEEAQHRRRRAWPLDGPAFAGVVRSRPPQRRRRYRWRRRSRRSGRRLRRRSSSSRRARLPQGCARRGRVAASRAARAASDRFSSSAKSRSLSRSSSKHALACVSPNPPVGRPRWPRPRASPPWRARGSSSGSSQLR